MYEARSLCRLVYMVAVMYVGRRVCRVLVVSVVMYVGWCISVFAYHGCCA